MFAEIPAAMATRMRELEARDADERRRGLPAAERLCQVPPETGRLLALLAATAPAGAGLGGGGGGGGGWFVFCSLDAAKGEHTDYYALAVPRLARGGLLVADNIVSHAEALAPFVASALADPRLDAAVLGVGKGLLLGRRT